MHTISEFAKQHPGFDPSDKSVVFDDISDKVCRYLECALGGKFVGGWWREFKKEDA